MSITSALKKLAKNVFNVNTTGDNIDEILNDIANNASGGSGGSIPVFHYTSDTPVASADMYAFLMEYKDKPFYIDDDEYGLIRTILCCDIESEKNFIVCALKSDGVTIDLFTYRPDPFENPEFVSSGQSTVWDSQG